MSEYDLDVMMPKPIEVPVYSRKEVLEVWPVQLTEIKQVIAVCAPLIVKLKGMKLADSDSVMSLILECVDDLPQMLSACLGKPIEYFTGDAQSRALQLDEYTALAMAVLRQNVDFFTQRLFPSVLPVAALLAARQRKPAVLPTEATSPKKVIGRGPSRPSSAPGTGTKTSGDTAGDSSSVSSTP